MRTGGGKKNQGDTQRKINRWTYCKRVTNGQTKTYKQADSQRKKKVEQTER